MPCYDSRDSQYAEMHAKHYEKCPLAKQEEEMNQLMRDIRDRNNMLSRTLCFIVNGLKPEHREILLNHNKEFRDWWVEHEEFDKNRKEV